METVSARTPVPKRAASEDGLGKRYHGSGPGGEPLEVLEFREEFSKDTSFESALRERIAALAGLHSTCFPRVRSVQRLRQLDSKLVVVSDRIPGTRLSTLLAIASQHQLLLEVNTALCLIRQLVPAIAALHQTLPTMAHGAIAPERIVVTPKGRLVVVEHMLGSALEQLHFSHDRYWREFRVPLPPTMPAMFDQRADVMQVGMVAVALILGRPIDHEEYLEGLAALVERASGVTATGGIEPLPAALRTWLLRMLLLDPEHAFASAVEAWAELERVLGSTNAPASTGALEAFMAECARAASPDVAVTPRPSDVPTPAVTPVVPASPVSASTMAMSTSALPPSSDVPAQAPSTRSPSGATVIPFAAVPQVVSQTPASDARATLQSGPEPPLFATFVKPTEPVSKEPQATPETATPQEAVSNGPKPSSRRRWVVAAAIVTCVASVGVISGHYLRMPASIDPEAPATLVVSTNPPGVPVLVDGQSRGVTPLTMQLAPGSHELKLAAEDEPRIIPLKLAAGSTVSHTIELPKSSPRTGQITVRSEPSGARVQIDGAAIGTTPLSLDGLIPGTHTVTLATDVSSVTQEVTIDAGATAALVVPMTAPRGVPVSGWISVQAPAEVHVYEDGRLLGTSQTDRIMVSAGTHNLDIANQTLDYRVRRSLSVEPGKVSAIRLEWPKGSMALNAQPWAEVWVDGENVGETPIGKITVPIGIHTVIFRHPQFGEQVVRATVTATAPARVSVDMSKR